MIAQPSRSELHGPLPGVLGAGDRENLKAPRRLKSRRDHDFVTARWMLRVISEEQGQGLLVTSQGSTASGTLEVLQQLLLSS